MSLDNARVTTDTPADPDCVFCNIAAGRLPASLVYSGEEVLAFLDVRPVTAGHLLVIPRRHAAGLAELDPATGGAIFTTAQQLAAAIRASGLPCAGINLYLADGAVAGQEVFHVHLHVLPRTEDDGFALTARFQHPARAELDATAELIRAAR
jgi:histidine triad (HIT) family protein